MKTKQQSKLSTNNSQLSNAKGLKSQIEQAPSTKAESNSQPSTNNTQPTWKGVFFNGPEPDQDREGEEIPVWTVFVGDADANPLSRVYRVFSFAKAENLAKAISHDRKLELIAEAQAA